ncbi:MAG: DUF418 domain-containing protein [Myxococcales bacterium]
MLDAPSPAAAAHSGPTQSARKERIVALDVVRGAAIFGILMVNAWALGSPYPWYGREPWTDGVSRSIYASLDFVFVSKFFPLFSLLFGMGLSLQIAAFEARGESPRRFVLRRLGVLFLFGLVHLALLSPFDILVPYALLGCLTLALRKLPPRRLLTVAGLCLCVPPVLSLLHAGGNLLGSQPHTPHDPPAAAFLETYQHGSLAAIYTLRFAEIAEYYFWSAAYAFWIVAAMMTLGMYAVRSGLLEALLHDRMRLGSFARRALGFGAPIALVHTLFWRSMHGMDPQPGYGWPVLSALGVLGEPWMAIGYACGLAWWTPAMPGWLSRKLAAVGKLALSNYVLQSLVMFVVFMAPGFGSYGKHSPAWTVGFCVVLYACQCVLSERWLRRHELGPLERLWRRFT